MGYTCCPRCHCVPPVPVNCDCCETWTYYRQSVTDSITKNENVWVTVVALVAIVCPLYLLTVTVVRHGPITDSLLQIALPRMRMYGLQLLPSLPLCAPFTMTVERHGPVTDSLLQIALPRMRMYGLQLLPSCQCVTPLWRRLWNMELLGRCRPFKWSPSAFLESNQISNVTNVFVRFAVWGWGSSNLDNLWLKAKILEGLRICYWLDGINF